MEHGFLIRCDAAGRTFEVIVGAGAAQSSASGCSVVIGGLADARAILDAHLADRPPKSPKHPAAVALWDGRTGVLRLIRDRTGLYPLFYAETAHSVVASPDARALIALPDVSGDPDPLALAAWLAGVNSDPEKTLFRNVRRVPAGHMLAFGVDRARTERLWMPPREGSRPARDASAFGEVLESAIAEVVEGRSAVFLSGGIDSSAVAAAARAVSAARPIDDPLALCVEIDGASEEPEQRAVADGLGLARIARVAAASDELAARSRRRAAESLWPAGSPWQPVYDDLVADARAAGVIQILDGIGGDELLDAALLPARRAVTRLRIGVIRDLASAERGYVGGGMRSVLRAAAPRRSRQSWEPPAFIAPRYRSDLVELASVSRDDLLSTRIAAAWEESWDAGNRQGVTYHHPLWSAGVVDLIRGLPLEALVAKGQAKSPARSYLGARIPSITGPWPRPGVADPLLTTFESQLGGESCACLLDLGVLEPPTGSKKGLELETIDPRPISARIIALEQWLRSWV